MGRMSDMHIEKMENLTEEEAERLLDEVDQTSQEVLDELKACEPEGYEPPPMPRKRSAFHQGF